VKRVVEWCSGAYLQVLRGGRAAYESSAFAGTRARGAPSTAVHRSCLPTRPTSGACERRLRCASPAVLYATRAARNARPGSWVHAPLAVGTWVGVEDETSRGRHPRPWGRLPGMREPHVVQGDAAGTLPPQETCNLAQSCRSKPSAALLAMDHKGQRTPGRAPLSLSGAPATPASWSCHPCHPDSPPGSSSS
jgi:hypothetical protein